MSLFRKVKETVIEKVAATGRKWPDEPWKKDLPIKRRPDGARYNRIIEARDVIETSGSCPMCGKSSKVAERWIYRIYGEEDAPWYDRFPQTRVFQCPDCGTVLEDFTDSEKDDAGYQRSEVAR